MIVSDGEDFGSSGAAPPEALIERVRRAHIVTHTLVVGSTDGASLNVPAVGRREPVVTKARPERMAAWASAGGGTAWRVTPTGEALPTQASDIVPARALAAAAHQAGDAALLAPWLYALAAVLLVLDLLLWR